MWGLFLGAKPLEILQVLGGELFRSSRMGLGLCTRGRKVKRSIATVDKEAGELSMLVTCLDTMGLQA